MTNNNNDVEFANDDFPIMVADGAYTHFMDDFISLYFYQNRIMPPKRISRDMMKNTAKRELLGEIRMSANAINKLLNEINEGLKFEAGGEIIMGKKMNSWSDPIQNRSISGTFKNFKMTKTKEDMILFRAFMDTFDNVNSTGRKKINELLANFFHEHIDELNEIKEKYTIKKTKVSKNESKSK